MKKTAVLLLSLLLCILFVFSSSAETMMTGGWTAAGDIAVTDEIRAAFDKAAENPDGCMMEPMAVLGTQVVAGINYCILCRSTPVAPDAEPSPVLVYLYAGVDGTAEFLDIVDVDFTALLPMDEGR